MKTPQSSRPSTRTRYNLAYLTGPMIFDRFTHSRIMSNFDAEDVNFFIFSGGMLENPYHFSSQRAAIFDLISPQMIDGLMINSDLLGHYSGPERINALCQKLSPIPMVKTEPFVEGMKCILTDYYSGMFALVSHLIEVHQYQRIAYIQGSERSGSGNQRFQAYLDALRQHNIPFDPDLVAPGTFYTPSGHEAVELFLDQRKLVPQVTLQAIVAANDRMALDALLALQQRGLRVPEDVALAGFDDDEETIYSNPPITTVTVSFYKVAFYLINSVLAQIRGENVPDRTLIPCQLVVRNSCGCASFFPSGAASSAPLPFLPPQDGQNAPPWLDLAQIDREKLFARLLLAANSSTLPAIIHINERFLELFLEEACQPPGEIQTYRLLERLRAVFTANTNPKHNLRNLHKLLYILRGELLPRLKNPDQRQRFEELCQIGQVLVNDLTQHVLGQEKAQNYYQTPPLSDLVQDMNAALEPQHLIEILAAALPKLGIPGCYLSLYQDPHNPAGYSRWMLGYNEQGRLDLPPEGLTHPSWQLIPEGLAQPDQPRIYLVEPLFFQTEPMGYVVFESPTPYVDIFDTLRDQISSTLHRIRLYHSEKQALLVAENANRLKSQFLTIVGHELRTPISMIVSLSDLLLKEQGAGRERFTRAFQQELDVIHATGQHLDRLLRDVLDLGASQLGQLNLEFEVVEASEVISEAAVIGEQLAREKGLRWKLSTPTRLPLIRADRTRLHQILLNLLSNACKFTSQGAVELEVEADAKKLTIIVRDTGLGIPINEQDAIFNEFKQSERTTARGYGGLGLGLAITRTLVEMHGGEISVASSGQEGSGTTFAFSLPVAEIPPRRSPAAEYGLTPLAEVDPIPPEFFNQAVIVITEKPDQIQSLLAHLKRREYKTVTLTNETSATWLRTLSASTPGAVIFDCDPHATWSVRLFNLIRENPALRELPVLFYSYNGDQNTGSVLELGLMEKPLGASALLTELEKRGIKPKTSSSRPPVILVVDDELPVLEMTASLVLKQIPGCQVLKASSGAKALKMMQETRPDLVLLDLMMPEMDGFAVLEQMHGLGSIHDIPVIILTAKILTEEVMTSFNRCVTAVISKGIFTQDEMLKQIDSGLKRSKRFRNEAQRIARQTTVYLHQHFAEKLTREEIAHYVGVDERYLTRCFHEVMGISPSSYLQRYRVNQAMKLLDEDRMSITEIGMEVGFGSGAYFSRVFHKETGVTPLEYRSGKRPVER